MAQLPDIEQYLAAFNAILPGASPAALAMLRSHAAAPGGVMTATELARAAGYSSYGVANVQYGKFARRLCEFLGFHPDVGNSGSPTQTYVLARSSKLPCDDWRWTMHPVVVEALSLYEWAPGESVPVERPPLYAGEVPEGETYWEGAVERRLVNARERSQAARAACLDYWGSACQVVSAA